MRYKNSERINTTSIYRWYVRITEKPNRINDKVYSNKKRVQYNKQNSKLS